MLGLRGEGFPFPKSSEEENLWGWDAEKRTLGSELLFPGTVTPLPLPLRASVLQSRLSPSGPPSRSCSNGSASRPEMRLIVFSRGFLRGSPSLSLGFLPGRMVGPTLSSRLTHLFEGLLRARNLRGYHNEPNRPVNSHLTYNDTQVNAVVSEEAE